MAVGGAAAGERHDALAGVLRPAVERPAAQLLARLLVHANERGVVGQRAAHQVAVVQLQGEVAEGVACECWERGGGASGRVFVSIQLTKCVFNSRPFEAIREELRRADAGRNLGE